jgi:hypothetical protein
MAALGRLVKTVVSVGVIMALAMVLVAALTPSDAAAAACALSIPSCGCTINSPGNYTLTGASPMNSAGTCIDITASNVTLTSSSIIIKGPGSGTATFGVHIEPTARKVMLEGIEAEDFGQGIRVDGPNASLVQDITVSNNKGTVVNGANAYLIVVASEFDNLVGIQVNASATDFVGVILEAIDANGAGIKLNGVSGTFIDEAVAEGNGTFGIWLASASNNEIDGFISESNGVAGVYLGCNAAGPNGTACPAGVPSSNGNSLIGSVYGSKNSVVSNTGTPHNQRFGVAVGLGNLHNHFLTITGSGNVSEDALDENPNCGNNRWFADTFATSNPAKNTSFFCLN